MKYFTVSISSREPDSNPRESWKMNCGLLLNISWYSISWIPRCEILSECELEGDSESNLWWLLDDGGIELQTIDRDWFKWANSLSSKGGRFYYLFSRRTEDLGILDWIAYFLQESRLSRICPPNDESAKMLAFAAVVDSFVHAERSVRDGEISGQR